VRILPTARKGVLEDMYFVHVFVVCQSETNFAHIDAFTLVFEMFLQCQQVFMRIFAVKVQNDRPLFFYHALDLLNVNLLRLLVRVAASDFKLHTHPFSRLCISAVCFDAIIARV
jgi:hypothetical protein